MSMKVLIISDAWHPQVNGVVRTYEFLCKELKAMGHQIEVIGPANFSASLPMPFYPEIKLVIRPYRRLKSLINDFKPDKIHIATEGPLGWAARKYCMDNNISYTSAYHTQFPDYVAKRFAWLIPPLYNAVHANAIRIVHAFHAPSSSVMVSTKSLENQLLDWGFSQKISHVSRGVDFNIFHPDAPNIFPQIKRPIALYVGRIAIEKNLEDFLNMKWEGSKILVGNGPVRAALERKYPDAIFVGKKTSRELADHYRSSDVFVFPSKTDTFGIVLIEALACGLPVAAYNVMGPMDIITDKSLGTLDDHDLSKASIEALRTAIPHICAEHVKKHYSWKKAGEQFVDML